MLVKEHNVTNSLLEKHCQWTIDNIIIFDQHQMFVVSLWNGNKLVTNLLIHLYIFYYYAAEAVTLIVTSMRQVTRNY